MIRARFFSASLLLLSACEPPPPAPPPAPAPLPPPAKTAAPVATTDFRETPPQAGPDPTFVPPKIEEGKLSNGIRVLFVERHDLQIVAVNVAVDRGSTEAAPGIARFLTAYETTGAQVSEALAYMQENKASADQAAVDFLKGHPGIWTKWLTPEQAGRVKAALGK